MKPLSDLEVAAGRSTAGSARRCRTGCARRRAARSGRCRARRSATGNTSAWRFSRVAAARHRLQAGALGERGDPRRLLAVEREQVLPREAAGALGGQRLDLVEQRAGAGVVALAAAPVAVELAERAEPLDLDAVAGIELEDELGAGEADALAAAQQPLRRPPLDVALERQEQAREPAGRELLARRHALEVGDDAAELDLARARSAASRARERRRRWRGSRAIAAGSAPSACSRLSSPATVGPSSGRAPTAPPEKAAQNRHRNTTERASHAASPMVSSTRDAFPSVFCLQPLYWPQVAVPTKWSVRVQRLMRASC